MPHIVFDRQSCSGFFSCVKVDPEDFVEGEEEKSVLTGSEQLDDARFEKRIDEEQLAGAIEAADVCPVDAIKVLDDEGNLLAGPEKLPVER